MKTKMTVLVTLAVILLLIISSAASAHVLADAHGVVAQLGHWLLELHHGLPLLLAIAAIVAVTARLRRPS